MLRWIFRLLVGQSGMRAGNFCYYTNIIKLTINRIIQALATAFTMQKRRVRICSAAKDGGNFGKIGVRGGLARNRWLSHGAVVKAVG